MAHAATVTNSNRFAADQSHRAGLAVGIDHDCILQQPAVERGDCSPIVAGFTTLALVGQLGCWAYVSALLNQTVAIAEIVGLYELTKRLADLPSPEIRSVTCGFDQFLYHGLEATYS